MALAGRISHAANNQHATTLLADGTWKTVVRRDSTPLESHHSARRRAAVAQGRLSGTGSGDGGAAEEQRGAAAQAGVATSGLRSNESHTGVSGSHGTAAQANRAAGGLASSGGSRGAGGGVSGAEAGAQHEASSSTYELGVVAAWREARSSGDTAVTGPLQQLRRAKRKPEFFSISTAAIRSWSRQQARADEKAREHAQMKRRIDAITSECRPNTWQQPAAERLEAVRRRVLARQQQQSGGGGAPT